MNGYHNGMHAGWWVVMSVLWIALIALIVWPLVERFFRSDASRTRARGGSGIGPTIARGMS